MFKKLLFSLLLAAGLFLAAGRAAAADNVSIYFFWGDGCPHCAKEEIFLDDLKTRYPQIQVREFEVWKNPDNRKLLAQTGERLNVKISGVPFTVVGEKYFSGWFDEKTTGAAIEEALIWALNNDCRDIAGEILNAVQASSTAAECAATSTTDSGRMIDVPVLGRLDLQNFSLPAITVVLGALDGFNPCAMWTLIFLIGLLLGMRDRKRMWILGIAFIAASAFVYFLFMVAWLNLLLFLGFIIWVRLAIGGVALFDGGYNLKEYFSKKPAVCKSSVDPKQQKIFAKLKETAHRENFYLALVGIILLAFAVNLVEAVCSAGLPAIFSQILALSDIAPWQKYAYISLYIFVFMLDDLIVFFTAMITLKMAGATAKYQRASHLVGGILMVAIGLLLIFKPEWLMFG